MMHIFQDVLNPAPTVPVVRWTQSHPHGSHQRKRSVAHGLVHAGRLLIGFFVVVLTMAGLSLLSPMPRDPKSLLAPILGWWLIPLAATIMIWTAHRWAPFSIAFLFGPGLRNSLTQLVTGPSSHSTIIWRHAPRVEAFEMCAYFALVIALTWRFLRHHPAPTTFVDRCCLTTFAIATLDQLVRPHLSPTPLLLGLAALVIAWVAYRLQNIGNGKRKVLQEAGT